MQRKVTHVAAAVILHPDGRFLLAQRPAGKVYSSYWEFPGGKVEAGETAYQALCRELHEELGVTVSTAYPWLTRTFDYPHALVKLHFFRVVAWQGEPYGREGQAWCWQWPEQVSVAPLLPANQPIVRALALPPLYAISNAAALGEVEFLCRLSQALKKGLRLLQVREKYLPSVQLTALATRVITLAHEYGAKVLINGDVDLAQRLDADGVHLTEAQLQYLSVRPDLPYCAASCHSAASLQRAGDLGLDFAVLSPVLPTLSHPGAPTLGWEKFAELRADAALPVYALGGLELSDLPTAWQHGAHGVSLLRQAW